MRFLKGQDAEYQLDKILNEGIRLDDNVDGALIEFTFSMGDNEVHHGLGRVPYGVIVLLKNGPGEIYGVRDTEWTKEILYLRCDATSLKVRLFVV